MTAYTNLLYGISVLFVSLIGLASIRHNWQTLANRLLFFFCLGTIAWTTTLYFGFYFSISGYGELSTFFIRGAFASGVLFLFFLSYFVYIFPSKRVPYSKWAEGVFVIVSLTLFCVTLFTPLIYEKSAEIINGQEVGEKLGRFYMVFVIYTLCNYAFELYQSIVKIKLSKGIERKKMALSFSGLLAFILALMTTNLVLPLFSIYIFQKEAVLFSLFFLIPTFYAMHKYRFFSFSNASLNFSRVVIIYTLFFIVAISSYEFLVPIAKENIIRVFLSTLLGLLAYKFFEKRIPQLVTGEFKLLKNELAQIKGKLYYCNSYKDLESLIEKVFILKLNFVSARVYVVRKTGSLSRIPVYKESRFTKYLSRYAKDGLLKREIDFKKIEPSIKKEFRAAMEKLGADLFIPLFSEGNLIGFLALKKSRNYQYPQEIVNELLTITKDLEIALMNVLLKMNLQEENNLMKSIIEKKTKELKTRIEEINELLKQQSDFIAVTAHEFRTPLSIASFQMEDLLRSKNARDKKWDDLKNIDSSIANLKMLTEKLFAVQQYDLKKVALNLKRIEMGEYLKKIFHDFQPIMKNKGLHFEFASDFKKPIFCEIDDLQMRQVFHNLLTNASKFTPKGGFVGLNLIKSKKNDLLIRVEGAGDGIPDDLKKSIFEKFRTKAAGAGIGLGLYLCKKIVELHKGKLWVEDAKEGGASFCIRLAFSGQ